MKKFIALLLIVLTSSLYICPNASAKEKKVISGSVEDYRFEYVNIDWWDNFNDPLLKEYVIKTLDNNHDLKTATLKTEEYKNFVKMSLGQEMPQIIGGLQYNRLKMPGLLTGGGSENMDMYAVPLMVSYEADIFLKNRNKTRSVKKSYEASKYAEKAAYISLITSTATVYLNIVQLDKLVELQNEVLNTRKTIYDLTNERFKAGLSPESDAYTAEQAYLSAKVNLTDMVQQRSTLLNQLAVLTGQSAEGSEKLPRVSFDELKFVGKIPESIDSEIIFNRPDVLQAQAELERAKIDVRVARKELLPSISLMGTLGFASSNLSKVFNWENALAMLGAGLTQSLFTGGTKIANLKVKKVQTEQLFNNYQKIDLQAVQEVNDGLFLVKSNAQSNKDTNKIYSLEMRNYKWAQDKYKAGLISYLTQAQYREKLLTTQQAQVAGQNREYISYLTLYKAAGGKI